MPNALCQTRLDVAVRQDLMLLHEGHDGDEVLERSHRALDLVVATDDAQCGRLGETECDGQASNPLHGAQEEGDLIEGVLVHVDTSLLAITAK